MLLTVNNMKGTEFPLVINTEILFSICLDIIFLSLVSPQSFLYKSYLFCIWGIINGIC
jgi:hypothetical protein